MLKENPLKLRLRTAAAPDQEVLVSRQDFTLGRSSSCDLVLCYSGVSRVHARLSAKEAGSWSLEDLGSKNGTSLNGRLVRSPQFLREGDVICLGEVSLDVLSGSLPPPSPSGESGGQTVILRNAQELQHEWIEGGSNRSVLEQRETALTRLKDLVDIAKSLNSAVSIEAIFSKVQEVVFRHLYHIERLALLVDVKGTGHLQLLNAAARSSASGLNLLHEDSWISRSICHKAFVEQLAIQTADAQTDERFNQQLSIVSKGIRTAIAVPLWDENRVVGVLYADALVSSDFSAENSEEELRFFSALSNLVASSVQRWLLTSKLRKEEKVLQQLRRYHSPAVIQHIMTEEILEGGRLFPREGEISVLFADIVRFTDLAERLEPAEVAELLSSFFGEMLEEIFKAEGTLDKFIGDCVMAFFGAPEPQSDHADRAVSAAKGMLQRLSALNARNTFCQPLQLRVAVNSGRAVVGDVGSAQRVDYTALGATVNLASRLEAVCPPGQCVISADTYRLLHDSSEWQEMGSYEFKGIQQPVQVFCLTSQTSASS